MKYGYLRGYVQSAMRGIADLAVTAKDLRRYDETLHEPVNLSRHNGISFTV